MDPEPLRRLLREEPGRLPGGHRAEEEARGEADGARAGCDEVRQIAERTQIAEPALAREELSERCPGHELFPAALDRCHDRGVGGVDGAPARITREQDATLLQELAHGRDPEGQRRDLGIRSERAGGLVSAEPMAAREAAGHRIVRVHLPAGKGVVPGEELHAVVAPDHLDLERLRRSRR